MTPRPLLIENLDVDLGGRPVLRRVDLDVAPGEFVAVLGASGCGKTTLLRAIAGFVTPTSGRIQLGERLASEGGRAQLAAEARGLGVVFQDYALFPHLDVNQNIGFGLKGKTRDARVAEMLDLVRLGDHATKLPQALSGGQQQRVALARALAPAPSLLLLDEPFANLDASLRGTVADELRRILRASGTSALMVTHDRDEALGLADRIVVLQSCEGADESIVQSGSPEDVYGQPKNALVARTTGPVSLVEARVEADGRRADSAFGSFPLSTSLSPGDTVELLVRPEDLRAEADENGRAELVDQRYEGRGWRWELVARNATSEATPSLRIEAAGAAPNGSRFRLTAMRPLIVAR